MSEYSNKTVGPQSPETGCRGRNVWHFIGRHLYISISEVTRVSYIVIMIRFLLEPQNYMESEHNTALRSRIKRFSLKAQKLQNVT